MEHILHLANCVTREQSPHTCLGPLKIALTWNNLQEIKSDPPLYVICSLCRELSRLRALLCNWWGITFTTLLRQTVMQPERNVAMPTNISSLQTLSNSKHINFLVNVSHNFNNQSQALRTKLGASSKTRTTTTSKPEKQEQDCSARQLKPDHNNYNWAGSRQLQQNNSHQLTRARQLHSGHSNVNCSGQIESHAFKTRGRPPAQAVHRNTVL